MPRIPVTLTLLLLFAPAAYPACSLNIQFLDNPPRLTWTRVAGASTYIIQESFDSLNTSRVYSVTAPPFVIQRRTSADAHVVYTVTAVLKSNISALANASDACIEQTSILLKADPSFRALVRKAVVTIVGSGPGANGGKFKTNLKLTATTVNERGTIVFHPAGAAAQSTDPSMRYSLDSVGAVMQVDDIVGVLGRSGIGSLDIIPDEGASDTIPAVEARLYNDTANGTFGTTTSALLPYDFLHAPEMTIPILQSNSQFRISAGFRTLTDTKMQALIFGTNGRIRDLRALDFPADYTAFGPIAQLIGADLQTGESVQIFFDGAVIPFYTRTENRTNDPELFIPPPAHAYDVGAFVE